MTWYCFIYLVNKRFVSLLKPDTPDGLVEGHDAGFISRYRDLRMIIDYGKGKTLKNKETEEVTV